MSYRKILSAHLSQLIAKAEFLQRQMIIYAMAEEYFYLFPLFLSNSQESKLIPELPPKLFNYLPNSITHLIIINI